MFWIALQMWVAPFWMMLCGHALMDYALQTDWIAKGKDWNKNPKGELGMPWYYIMASHCLMHGGMVTVLTGSVYMGVAECLIHYLVDCLKCDGRIGQHEDQFIHVGCKALWAALFVATKLSV